MHLSLWDDVLDYFGFRLVCETSPEEWASFSGASAIRKPSSVHGFSSRESIGNSSSDTVCETRIGVCNAAIYDSQTETERLIFGYHPHGILPVSSVLISHTTQWREKLPGMSPVSLTAAISHRVPVIRDLLQWAGGMEVGSETFRNALQTNGCVLLTPGGQLEMTYSSRRSVSQTIVTSHKGFLRIALEMGASVTPVYSFGETAIFDNLWCPQSIQRWIVRKLQANAWFFPFGWKQLHGVPRPVPVDVVVGHPLRVPRVLRPSTAQVELLRRRYFSALRQLFERHKESFGYSHQNVVFVPEVEPLSEADWVVAWLKIAKEEDCSAHHSPSRRRATSWLTALTSIFAALLFARTGMGSLILALGTAVGSAASVAFG